MEKVDTAAHEAREIDEVIGRLQDRFPEVPQQRIRDVVTAEHRVFTGRPIRDYVPVFVERAAVEKLRPRP